MDNANNRLSWYEKVCKFLSRWIYAIFHWIVLISLTIYIIQNWEKCISMHFFSSFDGNNILFLVWLILIFLMLYDVEAKGFKVSKHKQKEIQESLNNANLSHALDTMSQQIRAMPIPNTVNTQGYEEGTNSNESPN